MDAKSNDGVFIRRPCEDPEARGAGREGCCIAVEAETGVLQRRAKEGQGFPGTIRSWEEARKDSFFEPTEALSAHQHLDFRFLTTTTGGE